MLSTTSKYALRVLVHLSAEPAARFILGRELAEDTRIPANYLQKILLALGNAGIVEAVRGHRGGYRLRRDPREIRLIEAVEVFEGVRVHPSCLLGVRDECSDDNPCSAHASFRDMRQAYIDFLEKTTIADVSAKEILHAHH